MTDETPNRPEPALNAPWPALVLVGAIFAGFGIQLLFPLGAGSILRFGFAPADLDEGRLFTLLTFQFLHGGLGHVVMNGLWALAFAPPVARLFGVNRSGAAALFAFYIVCGALAALGHALVHLHALGPPLVGASGGVAGLMGAAARLLRGHEDRPAPLGDRFVLTMSATVIVLFVVLGVIGFAPGMGPVAIAWQAHIVGYLAGLLLIEPVWKGLRRARDAITSWRLDSADGLEDSRFSRTTGDRIMLVAQILKTKGDKVFTASPNDTVAAAAALLHSRQVGAMVVTDEGGQVLGILSERDLIRVVAQQGAGALNMPVSSVMTRDVVFAGPGEGLDDLLARMTDRRIRHLPVLMDGQLAGIISIGDLVKWKIAETEAVAEDLKAYIAHG